ncbi:MAG: hypothetical protein ACRDMZ_01800 [Solirubrobacteraceae bacterium]
MLLRASSEVAGDAVELSAINEGASTARTSGIAHAEALIALADAQIGDDDAALAAARERVRREMGADALVDAVAVVANFERMVRIADATGTPLDAPIATMATGLRAELDLDRFGSAANTPRAGVIQRAFGHMLSPFAGALLRRMGTRMSRSRPDQPS